MSKEKLSQEEIQARIEAGQEAANERRLLRGLRKSYVAGARSSGIRFAHIGRLTIAYRRIEHSFVAFSVSIRNPSDPVDNLVGQANAVLRLSKQIAAVVPIYTMTNYTIEQRMDRTIAEMFRGWRFSDNDSRLERK